MSRRFAPGRVQSAEYRPARGKRQAGAPRDGLTGGSIMSMRDTLLPEFDQEMATTRRLLERVPGDKGTWKPHPKSFALGHLAQLVSWMPGWIANTITQNELDLAAYPGYSFETT